MEVLDRCRFVPIASRSYIITGIEDDYEDEDDDYSDDDSKFGQFFCPTCGMSFHRQDNLKRHQRLHVKEEFSNENEFGHVCNVCGESFPEALDLLAHAEVCSVSYQVLYIEHGFPLISICFFVIKKYYQTLLKF